MNDKIQKLIKVKEELAAKYRRRAEQTKSTPLKKRLKHRADGYQRQAEQLSRAK